MPGHTDAKTLDKMKFARGVEKLPLSDAKKDAILQLVLGIKGASNFKGGLAMKNGGVKIKAKKKKK